MGIVYSDCQRFGNENELVKFPEPTARDIDHQNFAHAGSLIRRAALECSDAFANPGEVTRKSQDDWYLWRRIHAAGWQLAKSTAAYRYRRHVDSHCAELVKNRATHFDLASLEHETITLFIPLSGRRWAWPGLRHFLENQTWPHDRTRLIFCDTSDDQLFSQDVRGWLARSDYIDCRHYWQTVGPTGLADDDRRARDVRTAVQAAMPRIYNRLAREATTEYVWVVEDDILPPLDAAERLLRAFDDQTASVSGLYPSRFRPGYVAWDNNGGILDEPAAKGAGIINVGGTGFGCVILRRSLLRQTVFQNATPTEDFDPNFFSWLSTQRTPAGNRWLARLDCRVECEHRDATDAVDSQEKEDTPTICDVPGMVIRFVRPWLAFGSSIASPEHVEALKANGITHVLNLRHDFDDAPLVDGLAYLWNGRPDGPDSRPAPDEWFHRSLEFIVDAKKHGAVFVHCAGGISRSPSTAYAALIATGYHPEIAAYKVRRARPETDLFYKTDAKRAAETFRRSKKLTNWQ